MNKKSKNKGPISQRDKTTIKRLKIYNTKIQRTKSGKISKVQAKESLMSRELPNTRIQPDRRWFGNTRVIAQKNLDDFREAMQIQKKDPTRIILKRQKLPIGLLEDSAKKSKINILEAESFEQTFGKKATRNRPKLSISNMSEFAKNSREKIEKFSLKNDKNASKSENSEETDPDAGQSLARERIFAKGQSKRIWGELYKVIDSSDVVLQVLDARDPMGTRSAHIEKIFKKPACHKNMILVLNKCDLIPNAVLGRWIKILSKEFPTVAFKASINNPFGKGSLIKLLRQYAKMHKTRKQISVGFIGYPNVGKSSIINALKRKKVCKVAPIAGETKVWQYVTLFKRIYLIDCPGVVYPNDDSDSAVVLKGVVRVENVDCPEQYVAEVLRRVKREHLQRAYGSFEWTDHEDFLDKFAMKCGKLLKGGSPDTNNASRMILHDWQRGRLAWNVMPDGWVENSKKREKNDNGKIGDADFEKKSAENSEKEDIKNEDKDDKGDNGIVTIE